MRRRFGNAARQRVSQPLRKAGGLVSWSASNAVVRIARAQRKRVLQADGFGTPV